MSILLGYRVTFANLFTWKPAENEIQTKLASLTVLSWTRSHSSTLRMMNQVSVVRWFLSLDLWSVIRVYHLWKVETWLQILSIPVFIPLQKMKTISLLFGSGLQV